MRENILVQVGSALLVLIVGAAPGAGQQPPGGGNVPKVARPQAPPDVDKQILNEIKEAYKAQYEVHEDVLKELRRSYKQPSAKREQTIFSELRRLYQLTDRQEASIRREIQRAYDSPSPEQEARIFREIERAERLPVGAVPQTVQAEQARKTFQKFDRDGDGALSYEEMPDNLRDQRSRWDKDRNGAVDANEYWDFYQGRLAALSEQVAIGAIDLKLSRGGPVGKPGAAGGEAQGPIVFRNGKLQAGLPDWFPRLDGDRDGQIGLYEWVKASRSPDEFKLWDRNGDGFITAEEALYYLARQAGGR
jgi:hypothetical protein